MVIKKLADLQVIIDAGKALDKANTITQSSATGDDFWTKIERVINGVQKLIETYQQLQGLNKPSAPDSHLPPPPLRRPNRQITDGKSTPSETTKPPEKQAENAKGNVTEMNQVLKAIIIELSNHIEACRKENPNMTAGECISRISFVNVTQLSAIMQSYLLLSGGNK